MRKKLFRNLFFTWFLSTVLTGVVFLFWDTNKMEFEDRQAATILFVVLTVFQNLAIVLFTLPILLQVDENNYRKISTKFLYLIFSPVVTIIIFSFYFLTNPGKDIIVCMIPAVSFCIIHFLFFTKLKTGYVDSEVA
jgi:hypothetical protein